MIVINKTLHLIFAGKTLFKVGTNIFKVAPVLDAVKGLIEKGDLLIVNDASEADNLDAVKHSTDKETAEAVAKASKVKGGKIKEAAARKALEIAETEAKIEKAINEAKANG